MSIAEKARNIRLLVLDVDGVLTDGSVVYTDSGEELKFFDVKDGHGIKLLMRAGIEVAIITGRSSQAVEKRAADLGITTVCQKALQKVVPYEEIVRGKNLKDSQVCVVGDDLPDLPILRRCGLSFAVADGIDEVKSEVDCITERKGGHGAVREVCERLLREQGLWEKVTARYY